MNKLIAIGKIVFGLILGLVIVVSVFPLLAPFKGYYHSRTVLSGSMEPKIPKGSVIINRWVDQKQLKVGDVITYRHLSDAKIIHITHRIVKVDKSNPLWRFETRGDANPTSDYRLITPAGIEGKVIMMIPLIGYLIDFFKTLAGFVLLVALPLLVFIFQQAKDVLAILKKRNDSLASATKSVRVQASTAKLKQSKPTIGRAGKLLVITCLALSYLVAKASFVTYAIFTSDQAKFTGVTLNTAPSLDTVAPLITNINYFIGTPSSPNQMKATISWNTDEPATSNLEWRATWSDPWVSLPLDPVADQTSHQRDIHDLSADAVYHFIIRSSDLTGNDSTVEGSFETSSERWGVTLSNIVINEYLPNPTGADSAPMPGGEWVELYNRGNATQSVSGWYLADSSSSNKLPITAINTTSSNPATTGLTLAPGEFMTVYRNGNSNFDLNNSSIGDTVQLYGTITIPFIGTITTLKDTHVYTWLLGDTVLENKSFARFPDGSSNWFDPIPSPNDPNVLEENPVCMPNIIVPDVPILVAANIVTPVLSILPEINTISPASSSATTVETSPTPPFVESTPMPTLTFQPTVSPQPSSFISPVPTGEPELLLSPSPTSVPEMPLTPILPPVPETNLPTEITLEPLASLTPSSSPSLLPTPSSEPSPMPSVEPSLTPSPDPETTPTSTPSPISESPSSGYE